MYHLEFMTYSHHSAEMKPLREYEIKFKPMRPAVAGTASGIYNAATILVQRSHNFPGREDK